MAITITQERKKQRYLILALAMMIFTILLVVWWGFFRGEKAVFIPVGPPVIYALPEIKIDWQSLENIRSEIPKPFEEISAFGGKFGRKNPFTPY